MFIACGLLIGNLALAQVPKLGYINSTDLLKSMPEIAKADTNVNNYAKTFQTELESMQKEYQTKVQAFQNDEKKMTDAIKEVKMKEIQDLQNRMESLQQSAQDKISQKKHELYSPILEKADKAIKEVGKEKGYDYIFDLAQGSVLYYKEGDNILAAVKAKLGLK